MCEWSSVGYMSGTRTVSTWGVSGGGKTTVAVNVADELGRRGNNVLAIDLDHQRASITGYLGRYDLKNQDYSNIGDVRGEMHLGEILIEDGSMENIIIEEENFDWVPAHGAMENFDESLAQSNVRGREGLLLSHMKSLGSSYDYFILDPRGSAGALVDNAIYATRNVLVPVELSQKGKDTIDDIHENIELMEGHFRRIEEDFEISLMGIIPNKVGDSSIYDEIKTELEDEGNKITPFAIRQRDLLKYAWRNHLPARSYIRAADGDLDVDIEYSRSKPYYDYELDVLEKFERIADMIEVTNG